MWRHFLPKSVTLYTKFLRFVRRYCTNTNAHPKETESSQTAPKHPEVSPDEKQKDLSKKQEIKALETWLFAEKFTVFDPNKPLAQQISEDAQFLFGRRPDQRWRREGWEIPFLISFVASGIVFVGLHLTTPLNDPLTWAKEEAKERAILKEREIWKRQQQQQKQQQEQQKQSVQTS